MRCEDLRERLIKRRCEDAVRGRNGAGFGCNPCRQETGQASEGWGEQGRGEGEGRGGRCRDAGRQRARQGVFTPRQTVQMRVEGRLNQAPSPLRAPLAAAAAAAVTSSQEGRASDHIPGPRIFQTLSSSKTHRVCLGDRSPTRLQYSASPAGRAFSVLDASIDRSERQTLLMVSAGLQPPFEPS